MLPKFPIIDNIIIKDYFSKTLSSYLENSPIYWNSYFIWDENSKYIKPKMYYYDVDYDINTEYDYILLTADTKILI